MADEAPADDPSAQAMERLDDPAVRALLGVLNEQLAQLEGMPGPVGELALTALAGLAEVYGQALARILELVDLPAIERMLGDELIGHLLALHGIHPEPVETRLTRVLEGLRRALYDQGGTVELDRIDDGVAVVRVTGGRRGSSADDVEHTVRRAVLTAVPELADVTVVAAAGSTAAAFVSLDALMRTATSTPLK